MSSDGATQDWCGRVCAYFRSYPARHPLKSCWEPWLVIDPKPFIGDPAYESITSAFNCGRSPALRRSRVMIGRTKVPWLWREQSLRS